MNPTVSAVMQFVRVMIAVVLTSLPPVVLQASAAQISDPTLNLTMKFASPDVVVSWSNAIAVPYQLESSPDLFTWSTAGPVVDGNGTVLSVTNPIAAEGSAFYRVKRIFPAAEGAAAYDPDTGLLTIVGDDSDNNIVVSVGGGGTIVVTIGGVLIPISGGTPTTSNTVLIQVLGLGGSDQITIFNGLPASHLFGGVGNDTLTGGSAADVLVGGPGADVLNGQSGNDRLFGEEDDDTFIWNPGGGSDVIEGGAGLDTLTFNGANIGEGIDLSAIGSRLRFFRDIATATMDVDGVEHVDFNAVGGADNIVVNNLAATAVTQVNLRLASTLGGNTGDSATDTITINGTAQADTFNFVADAGAVVVTGIGPEIRVTGGETNFDHFVVNGVGGDVVNVNGSSGIDTMTVVANGSYARVDATGFTTPLDVAGVSTLWVNGLGGGDTISCVGSLSGLGIPLHLDGGEGNDFIYGSNGNDTLLGGPGQDFIDGNIGNDTIQSGDDDDTVQWDPGDGSDIIEGGTGQDALIFNGSNIGENFDLSNTNSHLQVLRNIGTVTLDADGIERVDFNARGGADNVVVNSLAGTTVTQVNIDLATTPGGGIGDLAADTVSIYGTAGAETNNIVADAGAFVVSGPTTTVRVAVAESVYDRLIVNGLGGDLVNVNGSSIGDTMSITPSGAYARVIATGYSAPIDVTGQLTLSVNGLGGTDTINADTGDLASLNIPLRLDGGEDADNIYGSNGGDTLLGGPGIDVIYGNQGDDTILMGDGDDVFYWDPGDGSDVVEGGTGADTMVCNGSGSGEDIDLSAVGSRLHLFRNLGPFTLDVDGVERVDCNVVGGTDQVVVNSLAGTAVTQVNIDLAGTLGGVTGDSLADVITVNGTASPDTISIAAISGTVAVSGLSALVFITHSEVLYDSLIVNGLGGTDTINAGPGVTSLIGLTINQ